MPLSNTNSLSNICLLFYTYHRHNLSFCKTPQAETDANRFIGKTVWSDFSRGGQILKAQFMPVGKYSLRSLRILCVLCGKKLCRIHVYKGNDCRLQKGTDRRLL